MADPDRHARATVFFVHQTTIRPQAVHAHILGEWNSKTIDEQKTWVHLLEAAKHASNEALELQERTNDWIEDIDERDEDAVERLTNMQDFKDFFEIIATTRQSLQQLSGLYHQEEQAWSSLHMEESSHIGVNQDSINDTARSAVLARRNRQYAADENARIRRMLERPPVLRDPVRGVNRMREDWVQKYDLPIYSRARTIDGNKKYNVSGLNNPGSGTWMHWANFSGGMSQGSLWLKFDGNDRLVDRVFRKDCFLSRSAMKDPVTWHGDVRDIMNRTPTENWCHMLLEGGGNEDALWNPPVDGVVRLREPHQNNALDFEHSRFKFYLEFCPHGDLHSVICEAIKRDIWIPEPFIWYVAETLFGAASRMLQGPSSDAPWDHEMVHRDLKPANVFLGAKDDMIYTDYPKPLMGDFGLAILTPCLRGNLDPRVVDPCNPRWYHNSGTKGFLAPEQIPWVDQRHRGSSNPYWTLDERQIRSPCNVFGIGLILWCCVTRNTQPPDALWLGDANVNHEYDMPKSVWAQYDPKLLELIQSCLRYDPSQRPSAAFLVYTIHSYTGCSPQSQLDLTRGVRNGTASPPTWAASSMRSLVKPNTYIDGLVRNVVPR